MKYLIFICLNTLIFLSSCSQKIASPKKCDFDFDLCHATKGSFRWDGLREKQQKLPQGIYIIYTDVFNANGKTKKFKNTIVLARRN